MRKIYRLISLLPVLAKILEKLIFASIFENFIENKLFTLYRSGFVPGDSFTPQLLSIINEIQISFDEIPPIDVRGVYLDTSEVFDNVCHKGLVYKTKSHGIFSNLLDRIENYLANRKQSAVRNG